MKIEYDPYHDILNIEFLPERDISESMEFDGIIVDYGEDGKIVAIEILDISKRTQKDPLDLLDLSITKQPVAL